MCKSCISCVRILMIVFNTLFMVVGLVVLATSLYFYFSTFGMRGMERHNALAYTLVVVAVMGALSVVLGTLGCCGSYHYSRCLLGFYFILLLIIFAVEIALGVAGFVFKDEARNLVHAMLQDGVEELRSAGVNEIRWMSTIQYMFKCCGYNGQVDYIFPIPKTCCPNQDCKFLNAIVPAYKGCKERIDDIMHNFFILCVAIITTALVELIGLIFSMTLCCAVNGRDSGGYYQGVNT